MQHAALAAKKNLSDGTLGGRIGKVLNAIRRRQAPTREIRSSDTPASKVRAEPASLRPRQIHQLPTPEGDRRPRRPGSAARQRPAERQAPHEQLRISSRRGRYFAGHELDALSLNPDRWFIAPETDAGLAWRAWWYHPNPTGWLEEAELLLSDPQCRNTHRDAWSAQDRNFSLPNGVEGGGPLR